jgi:hypothetical protein
MFCIEINDCCETVVLMAVTMSSNVLLDLTTCNPVDVYRLSSETSIKVYQTTRSHISEDIILQNVFV